MKKILSVLLVVASTSVFAQKIYLKSGDLSVLKGQKEVDVEYDYSKMRVGRYADERDYVKDKVKDYNEKEAGRGDKWAKAWEGDRGSRFQPSFEELLNKYNKSFYIAEDNDDAKYKFVVKTTRTEPGFNVYVVRKNAEVDLEIILMEGDKEIAKVIAKNNPGRTFGGNDFDTGTRIEEAYAKAGKDFGKWLYKKYFK